jgi:hypothetical protein
MTRTLADDATTHRAGGATRCPDCTDGLGRSRPVEPGSFRERVHSTKGLALT